MPENVSNPEHSSLDFIRSVGSLPGQEVKPVPSAFGLSESSKAMLEEHAKAIEAQAENIPMSVRNLRETKDMAAPPGGSALENLQQQIERQLTFERFVEDAEQRVDQTTFPQEVRMASRDLEYQFVDAPPFLSDRWGYSRFHTAEGVKHENLLKLSGSAAVQRGAGFDVEPWRNTDILPKQQEEHLKLYLVQVLKSTNPNATEDEVNKFIKDKIAEHKAHAMERLPFVITELARSREEVASIGRIYNLIVTYRNAASGNEVGEFYVNNKLPMFPKPKEFATLLSTPPYYNYGAEVKMDPKDPISPNFPDYPAEADIMSFLERMGRTENAPLGENTQKETRLMYAVALSENPERLMQWKLHTEQGKLFDYLLKNGVSQAYLILKEKGFNYVDPSEDQKISDLIAAMPPATRTEIENSWWTSLGYKDAAEGISQIGDPETWIPLKARRGDVSADVSLYFPDTSARGKIKGEIEKLLGDLKKEWEALSPLKNLSLSNQATHLANIETLTRNLREKATTVGKNEKGEPKIITLFNTLSLERELGVRKGAAEIGCIWSKPQKADEIDEVMLGSERFKENKDKSGNPLPLKGLKEYTHGDLLAYENAKGLVDLFGLASKWGYFARDYDPNRKDPLGNLADPLGIGAPLAFAVDVEGWPYTSEFQNIMAWPWYQTYKAEAGGPLGSRGKYGPLMTDYLSAYFVPAIDKDGKLLYDQDGKNALYVIVDSAGTLKFGRAEDGMVLADTNFTLLEHWERGESLGDEKLWGKVDQDPFRRWALRSFFAEGRALFGPGGNDLLGTWKKREWKLEDLDNENMWDAYKLARKVTLREELFDEVVWKTVCAPINEAYKDAVAQTSERLASITDPAEKAKVLNEEIKLEIKYPLRTANQTEKVTMKRSELFKWWKEKRKAELYDYSSQVFWNGISSTESVRAWQNNEPGIVEKPRQEMPSVTIQKIIRRARTCEVNLIGNYTDTKLVRNTIMEGTRKF